MSICIGKVKNLAPHNTQEIILFCSYYFLSPADLVTVATVSKNMLLHVIGWIRLLNTERNLERIFCFNKSSKLKLYKVTKHIDSCFVILLFRILV